MHTWTHRLIMTSYCPAHGRQCLDQTQTLKCSSCFSMIKVAFVLTNPLRSRFFLVPPCSFCISLRSRVCLVTFSVFCFVCHRTRFMLCSHWSDLFEIFFDAKACFNYHTCNRTYTKTEHVQDHVLSKRDSNGYIDLGNASKFQ